MTTIWFASGLLVTTLCLIRLRTLDAKRARVQRRARVEHRRLTIVLLWIGAFLPGLALFLSGQYSAFLSWSGAGTIIGWGLVVISPR